MRDELPLVMALLLAVAGCGSGSSDEQDSGTDDGPGDVVDTMESDTVTSDTVTTDTAVDTVIEDTTDASDAAPPEFDCSSTTGWINPDPGTVGHAQVAHWKDDRSAALTINFDDSTPGQATLGVPAMISRGLTGTWFVNPGLTPFTDHETVWLSDAPAGDQELANHTMDHAGATDLTDAQYQIGEASSIIRATFPAGRSPLMAFNRGGGTTWGITEEQIQDLLVEHHCIERVHSTGIYPATSGESIFTQVRDHLSTGGWADNWGNIHFHGICNPTDTVNCVCDTPGTSSNCREYGGGVNNGAVSLTDFEYFLDGLVTDSYFVDDVWIAGFIEAHKYQAERNGSSVVMIPDTDERIALCLSSTTDPSLYDEPLTLTIQVPSSWTSCIATQAGATLPCILEISMATTQARPDAGAVVLSQG